MLSNSEIADHLVIAVLNLARAQNMTQLAVYVIPTQADWSFSLEEAREGAIQGTPPVFDALACHKTLTALHWREDTHVHIDTEPIVVLAYQGVRNFFCPLDGGILVFDNNGVIIACIGVHSSLLDSGSRVLAIHAAHSLGYNTNFNEEGLTDDEAKQLARLGSPFDYCPE